MEEETPKIPEALETILPCEKIKKGTDRGSLFDGRVKNYDEALINIEDLILKGYVFDRTVRKFTKYTGAIFVPIKFLDKKMRVILIPYDLNEELNL